MIGGKRVIAIIPARAGSKRLPGKNMRNLLGRPLIGWTIDAALGSEIVDRVIVSTDSEDIARFARCEGVEVPFLRSADLSDDTASTFDVVIDVAHRLDLNPHETIIVLLQPTSPFRTTSNIDESLSYFKDRGVRSVISVCETEHSPLWSGTLPPDRSTKHFLDDNNLKRSQDLPKYYRLNGAIYISELACIEECGSFISRKGGYAYVMGINESLDIDTQEDYMYAEFLAARLDA